jgi:hypothetical protein
VNISARRRGECPADFVCHCNRAAALVVNINTVSSPGRLSIDEHAKLYWGSPGGRPHDQVKITGVKAIHYPPVCLVQHNGLFLQRPIAR